MEKIPKPESVNFEQNKKPNKIKKEKTQSINEMGGKHSPEREKFLESLIKNTSGYFTASTLAEVVGEKRPGYHSLADKNFLDKKRNISWAAKTIAQSLRSKNVHEVVIFQPLQKPTFKKETYTEKTWFGLRKKQVEETVQTGYSPIPHSEIVKNGQEQETVQLSYYLQNGKHKAIYKDYTGKRSSTFSLEMFIPKSLADALQTHMKENPLLIREVVESFVLSKTKISEEDWHKGKNNKGNPIKPPYEKLKEVNNGIAKIYISEQSNAEIDNSKIIEVSK